MTDNTKMVDLPWIDGTTRTVREGTPYVRRGGYLAFAQEGGYSSQSGDGRTRYPHDDYYSPAVRILTEAPEPPVKVDVPTGIGAIVSGPTRTRMPVYVLTWDGWRGLWTHRAFDPSQIADTLSNGAVVLYEGVDE